MLRSAEASRSHLRFADEGAPDVFELEAEADAAAELGPSAESALRRIALLLFTPDAIVAGRVRAGLERLEVAGFTPIAATRVRLDRLSIREMWRPALAAEGAPDALERLAICDLVLAYSDSLALLLRDDTPTADLSAAARLSALKGGGEPAQRAAGTLRDALEAPDTVFRLMHASDTPRDMARELAILFPPPDRRRLLLAVAQPEPIAAEEIHRLANAILLQAAGPRDLENLGLTIDVRARARTALAAADLAGQPPLAELCGLLDKILEARQPVSVRALFGALDGSRLDLAPWDRIRLGARAFCPVRRDA